MIMNNNSNNSNNNNHNSRRGAPRRGGPRSSAGVRNAGDRCFGHSVYLVQAIAYTIVCTIVYTVVYTIVYTMIEYSMLRAGRRLPPPPTHLARETTVSASASSTWRNICTRRPESLQTLTSGYSSKKSCSVDFQMDWLPRNTKDNVYSQLADQGKGSGIPNPAPDTLLLLLLLLLSLLLLLLLHFYYYHYVNPKPSP